MSRPRKCRKVCCLPEITEFVPVGGGRRCAPVVMTVDEYEAIRLIDREGYSQEDCGDYMGIARTTVQQIYTDARENWRRSWWRGGPCSSRAAATGFVTAESPDGAAAAAASASG